MTAQLRPQTLADFGGQPHISEELSIVLAAARARGEVAPHLLFSGPPGLGKTTLAGIVGHEMAMPSVITSAPALEKPGDLISLLVSLDVPTVVFVDEIHQLPKPVEETLYAAMDDQRVDIVLAEGTARAKVVPMPLVDFTLIGATTTLGNLGGPFRDRFGYTARLRPYTTAALRTIVARNAGLLGLTLHDDAAELIAVRSRGTPRLANRNLHRVRDWVHTRGDATVDVSAVSAGRALDVFGVDDVGLDSVDRELLAALIDHYDGGPVGVATLAAAIGETVPTVENMVEPYLMRTGLLARTLRGRVATPAAYRHLGRPVPVDAAEDGPADASNRGPGTSGEDAQ